jgi:hypothetical protein
VISKFRICWGLLECLFLSYRLCGPRWGYRVWAVAVSKSKDPGFMVRWAENVEREADRLTRLGDQMVNAGIYRICAKSIVECNLAFVRTLHPSFGNTIWKLRP